MAKITSVRIKNYIEASDYLERIRKIENHVLQVKKDAMKSIDSPL